MKFFLEEVVALTNKAATRVKKKGVRLINWEEAHWELSGW